MLEVIETFKSSKSDYVSDGKGISPLMLVQIDSNNREKHYKDIQDYNAEVSEFVALCKEHGLTYYIDTTEKKLSALNERKYTEQEIINDIDVLIYKLKYSTGVDIPRINTLFMLRNTKSNTLYQQTVGRMRRNPLKDKSNQNDIYLKH